MKLNLKILSFLLIGFFSFNPVITLADDVVDTVQFSLVISSADEINLTAIKQVEKGINLFEAITQLVTLAAKDTDWGPQIISLGGVEAVGNTYWALYVNGSMSMVGAQDVILSEDTFIRLNMEVF
jgi:hypothetical protein